MIIHSSGQTIYSFTYLEGVDAGEEVDEVTGGASGMVVYRIGEVGGRANKGEVAGVYGIDFTADSLARDGMWGPGIKANSRS